MYMYICSACVIYMHICMYVGHSRGFGQNEKNYYTQHFNQCGVCLSLSVCLSVCRVCLYVCLSVCLSVCMYMLVCVSVCTYYVMFVKLYCSMYICIRPK